MPEPVNGGNKNGLSKDMPMEMRLLLAFLLMGAVMFVFQYLYAPPVPVANAPKKAPATAAETTKVQPPPEAPAPAVVPAEAEASATPERAEPPFVVETDLYHIAISNQGATVRSWQLKKWKDAAGKPIDLVNTASGLDFPFSLSFPSTKPAANVNWTWYQQTPDADHLGVTFDYSDGHVSVRKLFRFQQNSYLSTVSTEVTLNGQPVPHLIQWRGGFGDLTVATAAGNQRTMYYDTVENKLVELAAKSASKGPVTNSGRFSFGGIGDNYFAAVFLSEGTNNVQQTTYADTVRTPAVEKPELFEGVAIGDGPPNKFDLFVGPKDVNLLRRVSPKLEQVVDFGWIGFLAKPLFLIVNWVNGSWFHNFGWSIVVVTIAINLVLFPLRLSNMKSMRKMQALKPQIDAINAKYKNVSLRDPRKADQNQETMDLHKKHGVNPMGGCLPMALQIPFFFAFYRVFSVSVEMRGAPWMWVSDLSQPEQLPIHLLPIIMIASQFFMQKMTPQAAGVDPAQQKMMMFMPLLFGMFFYNMPSGLVLYYLTSNLVGMGLQWFFNKTSMADHAAQSVEPPNKKNGRK